MDIAYDLKPLPATVLLQNVIDLYTVIATGLIQTNSNHIQLSVVNASFIPLLQAKCSLYLGLYY